MQQEHSTDSNSSEIEKVITIRADNLVLVKFGFSALSVAHFFSV